MTDHAHAVGTHRAVALPEQVRQVASTYLAMADEAAPGLVEGLYLHGSLGFGEWYDGRSDVDFVAVHARRLDAAAVDLLGEVHEAMAGIFPRPAFDGFYATWQDLTRPPADCPDVPCILDGRFRRAGRSDVNPVTWHELARHGLTVRGPRLRSFPIWTDQRALREYTHGNLTDYWAARARKLHRFPAEAADPEIVAWFVLGVPRLHHLLATDRLTSKSGAGAYAVDAFGARWRPLVTEALAYRATGELAGVLDHERLGAQVAEFSDLVVRAGLAIAP